MSTKRAAGERDSARSKKPSRTCRRASSASNQVRTDRAASPQTTARSPRPSDQRLAIVLQPSWTDYFELMKLQSSPAMQLDVTGNLRECGERVHEAFVRGEEPTGLVPRAVLDYARAHGLYLRGR
jgi:hypothetical protein